MIDLDNNSLIIVKSILAEVVPNLEVRIFGSRIRDKSRVYSDIDLLLVGKDKISDSALMKLKEKFSESDLAYLVDIIDWNCISEEFKKTIESQGYEIIQKNNHDEVELR